jgi:hypothetical protein
MVIQSSADPVEARLLLEGQIDPAHTRELAEQMPVPV